MFNCEGQISMQIQQMKHNINRRETKQFDGNFFDLSVNGSKLYNTKANANFSYNNNVPMDYDLEHLSFVSESDTSEDEENYDSNTTTDKEYFDNQNGFSEQEQKYSMPMDYEFDHLSSISTLNGFDDKELYDNNMAAISGEIMINLNSNGNMHQDFAEEGRLCTIPMGYTFECPSSKNNPDESDDESESALDFEETPLGFPMGRCVSSNCDGNVSASQDACNKGKDLQVILSHAASTVQKSENSQLELRLLLTGKGKSDRLLDVSRDMRKISTQKILDKLQLTSELYSTLNKTK